MVQAFDVHSSTCHRDNAERQWTLSGICTLCVAMHPTLRQWGRMCNIEMLYCRNQGTRLMLIQASVDSEPPISDRTSSTHFALRGVYNILFKICLIPARLCRCRPWRSLENYHNPNPMPFNGLPATATLTLTSVPDVGCSVQSYRFD